MTGRPTILTDQLRDDLCEHIASPMAVRHACALVGLGESTFYDWMNRAEAENADPAFVEFSEAVSRARAAAAEKLVEMIRKRAVGFESVRTTRGGEEVREWDSDWKAAAWLLERMAPDEYGNRTKVEHSGRVDSAVDIELPAGAGDAAMEFVKRLGEQADEAS